jgi:hypothetical protein
MRISSDRRPCLSYLIRLLIVVVIHLSLTASSPAEAAASKKNAIGACAGAPQTLAITYERQVAHKLGFRVHAGSVYFFSSAGARLQWGSRGAGLKPYLFAGITAVHAVPEDDDNPDGTTSYLWLGPGVSFNADRLAIFAEICTLQGGNDDKGFGDDWIFPFDPLAFSGGIMVRF